MHPASVTGSPRFVSRTASLFGLAALGWACAFAGCGGGSSGGNGTGGKTDAGTHDGGTGGRGFGGSGAGGLGIGGSTGTGGMGTGGLGTGGSSTTTDASDANNVCADAGNDAGPGDLDFDGVPDCLDGCPDDNAKIAPGLCGCHVMDIDSDGDTFPDCVDACPHDATRHTAGVCGCLAVPDNTPLCLVHRYSFSDTTATIADSVTITGVSPANGTASGTVPAAGRIVLAGGANQTAGQYVTLPAHSVSTLGNNATFEAWVTWNPVVPTTSGSWQRVFDFGSSTSATPGTPANGVTYLFMSPSNGANLRARTAITLNGNGAEDLTDAPAALTAGQQAHVVVVVDGTNKLMTMYVNGAGSVSTIALRDSGLLSQLDDVNNWLGRSQWAGDQLFAGSINEFRIYGRALSQPEVLASFNAGPDAPVPPPPVDGGTPDAGAGDGGSTPDGGAGDAPASDAPAPDAPADTPAGG